MLSLFLFLTKYCFRFIPWIFSWNHLNVIILVTWRLCIEINREAIFNRTFGIPIKKIPFFFRTIFQLFISIKVLICNSVLLPIIVNIKIFLIIRLMLTFFNFRIIQRVMRPNLFNKLSLSFYRCMTCLELNTFGFNITLCFTLTYCVCYSRNRLPDSSIQTLNIWLSFQIFRIYSFSIIHFWLLHLLNDHQCSPLT